jgi:hypothetical protein
MELHCYDDKILDVTVEVRFANRPIEDENLCVQLKLRNRPLVALYSPSELAEPIRRSRSVKIEDTDDIGGFMSVTIPRLEGLRLLAFIEQIKDEAAVLPVFVPKARSRNSLLSG